MCICTSGECYQTYADRIPMYYCHDILDDELVAQLQEIMNFQKIRNFEAIAEWRTRITKQEVHANEVQDQRWTQRISEFATKVRANKWGPKRIKLE